MRYTNKVAIVTGGASGIGRALCEELAAGGAITIVADINIDEARSVADALMAAGHQAIPIQVDVAKPEAVEQVVEYIVTTYGHIDYIFNNAGIGLIAEMQDMTLDHWRRMMDVNLWGVIHGTTAAYPHMLRQQSGHIVNTASAAGLFPTTIFGSAYSATKYAVVGFSTALRPEAAGLGVKVSVVCPGVIQTGIFDATTRVNVTQAGAQRMFGAVKAQDATTCARTILRGVARNQSIIPITTVARLTWWFYRLFPGLYDWIGSKAAQAMRERYRQNQ
jgi:NAD(P)-dependent dehydrogenase (short-subunit alcohol dehydrogenase family)